jgi:2-dehydro-3-deoxygalactonokinase
MTSFFSCDWGTTSFRLRRVEAATGDVIDERREASGAKVLFSSCAPGDPAAREKAFADFLREQLCLMAGNDAASLDGTPVIISGMASSSVGWRELAYARVPVDLDGSGLTQDSFELNVGENRRVRIHLISGLCSETDMMRGEETEILGLFSRGRHTQIAEDGIAVLPGTHSKHVRLRHRQITGFHTYMTGELFDVLSAHSLLRASVQPTDGATSPTLLEPAAHEAFVAGVRASSTSGLARSLFQTRVRTVLQKVSPTANCWFLSGLLIGAELVDLRAQNSGVPVLLAAAEPLHVAYRAAFEILGFGETLSVVPPEEMSLASVRGHHALLRRWLKSKEASASLK